MKQNIANITKAIFYQTIAGLILFLMIETFWADFIVDILSKTENIAELLVIIGFLISMIISIIVSLLISEVDNKATIYAAMISFLLNLLLWIIISYAFVIKNYPEIISDLSALQKLAGILKIISIFAMYGLESPVYLWIISQFTYSIFYAILRIKFEKEMK
jgi:hypothetical protein